MVQHSRRALANSCSKTDAQKRQLAQETSMRRRNAIEKLRQAKREEKARKERRSMFMRRQAPGSTTEESDTAKEYLATSHKSNLTGITVDTDRSELFDTENPSCLLQPEATIGPYWVAGEYVREDVSEDQPGVPLYLSAQFLDVSSCDPVTDLYWEIWHCNSTGVYSGVVASGNGNSDDESNLNATFLRGMWKTDDLGSATIQTVFPGHYTGRATHVHIIGHSNATLLANNTIGTGTDSSANSTAIHIGQLFFDQDLISEVEATSPYSTNSQEITENADDDIFLGETTDGSPDPIVEYVLLGDSVEDGIFAWVTVGVNSTASQTTNPASTLTEDGGVANENSMGGGMGGGPPGSNSTSSSPPESASASSSDSAATSSAAASSGSCSA